MGKLFVIEGTDGSGKGTQFKEIKKKFDELNIEYKAIDFPNYDSPSSSLVKMYLGGEFGENSNEISPYIASTFYAVDRYATFKKDLLDYYNNGGIILADRYTTANLVHQAGKISDLKERDKFLEWEIDLEFNLYGLPKPTKVFWVNMPIENVLELIKDRKNKIDNSDQKDIHEKDTNHLLNAYNAAKYVSDKFNWCEIKCVNDQGIRSIEDINNEIFNIIKENL